MASTVLRAIVVLCAPVQLLALVDVQKCVNVSSSLTIAHRGASGYLPEHTLPAYRLAAQLGAHYIEPDLVMTMDGEIIARHDLLLDDTTDISSRAEFADRQWTMSQDGVDVTGFYAFNFTLAEIKTLRCKQRVADRDPSFDGALQVVTLGEIIDAVRAYKAELGITVGIYMEPKKASVHATVGLDIIARMVETLSSKGMDLADEAAAGCDPAIGISNVIVQSFSLDDLVRLDTQYNTRVPLIYLLGHHWNDVNLQETRQHAHGLGPSKSIFDPTERALSAERLAAAHRNDLAVHPWDFAIEEDSMDASFHGDGDAELQYYKCELGVDGVFANFPDKSVHACSSSVAESAGDSGGDSDDPTCDKRDLEVAVGILGGLLLLLLVYVAYTVYRYVTGYRYFPQDDDEEDDDGDTRPLGLGSFIPMT